MGNLTGIFLENMLRLALFLAGWLLCSGVLGQVWVTGRVLSEDGFPLEGANVQVLDENRGTVTDSMGQFDVEMNVPGRLRITHLNYCALEVLVKKGEFLLVALKPLEHRLDEVEVKAKEMKGVGMVSTSRRDLERMPALLGERDVVKYLALSPGVVTTSALDAGLYVRGGNSVDNMFLVDGTPIANPAHLTGILSVFDTWILSNSQLYKSGFPAEYNSGLSAYVNMHPEAEGEDFNGEATLGFLSSAFKYRGQTENRRLHYSVSARTSYLQGVAALYNLGVDDENSMPFYAFYDVTGVMRLQLKEKLSLSVFGLLSTDRLRLERDVDRKEAVRWGSGSAIAHLQYRAGESVWDWKLSVNHAGTGTDLKKNVHLDSETLRNDYLVEWDYRSYAMENWRWEAGMRLEYGDWRYGGLEQWGLADTWHLLLTGYVQGTWSMGKGWMCQGGMNYQYYQGKSDAHRVSPRLKVVWARQGWQVWGSVDRTMQYHSVWTVLNLKSPVDIWCPLGKGAKPATCWQYSVGADKEWENGWYVYGALFWKDMRHIKDFKSFGFSEDGLFEERQADGKGQSKGVEVEVSYERGAWNWRANYTLSDAWNRFEGINDGKRFYPPYDVRHHALFAASWQRKKWCLSASWRYASGMRTTFPVGVAVAENIHHPDNSLVFVPIYKERYNFKMPAQHQLDISADYRWQRGKLHWTCTVGVYNLYNRQNPVLVYFEAEEYETYYTRFVPYSRVLLPYIPYISLTLNW